MSKPLLQQHWKHLLFLHWRIPAKLLQPHIPPPFCLDLFEGDAVLSIVPFKMENIRFRFLPEIESLPGIRNLLYHLNTLWELNLRTYVRVGNKKGVYFFTLDTDNKLAQWIASRFFHLPYRMATIKAFVEKDLYYFESQRSSIKLKLTAKLLKKQKEKTPLDLWATERHSLFTISKKNVIYEGCLTHPAWPLQEAKLLSLKNQFSQQIKIPLSPQPDTLSYTPSLHVQFFPFRSLS